MELSIPSRDADPRKARAWGELNLLMASVMGVPAPARWRVRFAMPFSSVPVSECRVYADTAHEALGRDVVRRCMAVTGWDVTSVTRERE
jgi:hypothetical protein